MRYTDRFIPAAARPVLEDGRSLALRGVAATSRGGMFEILTNVTAEPGGH